MAYRKNTANLAITIQIIQETIQPIFLGMDQPKNTVSNYYPKCLSHKQNHLEQSRQREVSLGKDVSSNPGEKENPRDNAREKDLQRSQKEVPANQRKAKRIKERKIEVQLQILSVTRQTAEPSLEREIQCRKTKKTNLQKKKGMMLGNKNSSSERRPS